MSPIAAAPLAHGYVWEATSAFVAGFLTSLTPCVYPLIPITMSLFGAKGATRGRALALAATYVNGMGLMYAALGVVSGLFGYRFGTFMANPWVVAPIALFFVAMAFSMFGAFELSLPSGLQTRLAGVGGSGFGGAFAMGLVGGIIAAPCTGPVLLTLLTYVTTQRSVFIGGSLLYIYALGMGIIFFGIAGFSASLPKSGSWMDGVKSVFGVLMFVGALYFLRNVIPPLRNYGRPTGAFLGVSIALVLIGVAVGAVHLSFHDALPTRVRKSLGILLLTAGTFSVITFALTPKHTTLVWSRDEGAARAAAKSAGRPLVIDFYADWCVPCSEFDVKTFHDDDVAHELERFGLLKVDCTNDDNPEVGRLQKQYDAATLPAVVILSSDGKLATKIDHFMEKKEFLPILQKIH